MYEALIKALRTCVDNDKDCSDCPYEERCRTDKTGRLVPMVDAAQALEDSINSVPVVLCGECEFFKPDKETPASISWYGRCQKNNRQWKMAVADFCSNGWRKDDD